MSELIFNNKNIYIMYYESFFEQINKFIQCAKYLDAIQIYQNFTLLFLYNIYTYNK